MKRHIFAPLSLASALFALTTLPALAVTNDNAVDSSTPYVAAFASAFGPSSFPHAGEMRLLVQDGRITGTYTGISVAPDFFNDRIEPVTGTVDRNDGHVQFDVGSALAFNGTMSSDGTISGTAEYRGRLYDFMAKPR